MNDIKKYVSYRSISKDNFNDFIKSDSDKNIVKLFNKVDNETYIDSYSIQFGDSNRGYIYHELWLFDLNFKDDPNYESNENTYYPVFIPNINTSSPYALWTCYFEDNDYTENDDDIKEMYWSFDKLINKINIKYRNSTQRILSEYWY